MEQPILTSSPLRPLHERHEHVEFQPYGPFEIVTTLGEPEAEYAAVRKSSGLIDMPQRGILQLRGRDRLPFLQNLLTNQTWNKQTKSGLGRGEGVYAFFLNLKGRIVADINVLELGDRTLLEMDRRMTASIRSAFEKYLFAEQVSIVDRAGELHELSMHGPRALEVLSAAAETPLAELPQMGATEACIAGVSVVVWRDDPTGAPGYHLIVPTADAPALWNALLERFGQPTTLGKRSLRPIGWAAFNATRIEGGRPMFGIDFDESVLPAETGQLARAVSFTKGCYLGQEIVARMHARGQVARQIVGLRLASDALPIAGAKLFDKDANEIGGITSSTVSPVLSNIAIALGYVKKPFIPPGTKVTVPAEGQMREATVVELPFVKPGTM
jgi:aminomethyltransferase